LALFARNLMDYGASLSTLPENPNRRRTHYPRQDPFEGSVRHVRGKILELLVGSGQVKETDLCRDPGIPEAVVKPVLSRRDQEGFIERVDGRVGIQRARTGKRRCQPRR
jgi:A/G-specific adenine glycosylase